MVGDVGQDARRGRTRRKRDFVSSRGFHQRGFANSVSRTSRRRCRARSGVDVARVATYLWGATPRRRQPWRRVAEPGDDGRVAEVATISARWLSTRGTKHARRIVGRTEKTNIGCPRAVRHARRRAPAPQGRRRRQGRPSAWPVEDPAGARPRAHGMGRGLREVASLDSSGSP
jgi:hypothetical protein